VPADTSGIISIAGNPGGVGSSTVYDVRKHGAQCDGITDDAPAINATILEASVGTGGAVFFPPGICRVASTVSINHYGIVLKGSAPLATTILGDLELTPVVQFGTAALFVESVGIENIRVSRALDVGNLYPLSRGIPPNSIGVLWADYNQASQFNLYTDRHYIGEKLTMTGTTSLSVGMNSFNYQSWNCTYSYLDVDSATDSNFFGGELGKNGGELVDPFSAVVFTGLAESFHMFGTDIIPLGPNRAAYMFAWVGNTSANGVFEFIGINGGDNSNYAMYSDAATPSISYMKILGGRWQTLTGIFAFNAATALIAFKIDAAMFPPPFILPIGTGSTVEIAHAEMFSGVTLLGSGTGSLMFSGNTISGPSTFSGTYGMFNRNGNSFLTNDPTTTVTATSFRVHGDLGPGGPLFDTPKPKFVYSLSPPNGQNNDVPTTNQSYIWLAGGIGTFSVSGFSGGVDGQIITVINPSGQYWGFLNNTGSSVGNRIFTYTGGDVTSLIAPVAQFVYDSNLAGVGGWWMVSR
jgi:hypothetical protein